MGWDWGCFIRDESPRPPANLAPGKSVLYHALLYRYEDLILYVTLLVTTGVLPVDDTQEFSRKGVRVLCAFYLHYTLKYLILIGDTKETPPLFN